MPDITELRELQRRFHTLLTGCRPAHETAARPAHQDALLARPERWIVAPDRATAFARLDVYAEMYFVRLCAVLEHDYPALAASIGRELFARLARDYLAAHPSQHGSVRHLGRELPAFVRTHALSDRWPFLADLALLELTRGDAIDAPDADPVGADELARVPADDWAALRLALVPACSLLRLAFPVHRLWLAVKNETPPPAALAAQPTRVLVWRQDVAVYHRCVEPREYAALRLVEAETPFAEICQRLAGDQPAEEAAAYLVQRLRTWVNDGLVRLTGPDQSNRDPQRSQQSVETGCGPKPRAR